MNSEDIEKQLFVENLEKNILQPQQKSIENDFQDKHIKGQALMPLKGIINKDYIERINKSTYTWYDKLKGLVPIYAIDRHRLSTDGEGVTTLVAFHKCSLKCKYCINPQTWDMNHITMKLNPQELYEEVRKDNLYFLATGGGVTFGGGEPVLHSDFIVKFKKTCNPKWKLTIETSLCVKQSHIKKLLPIIDYWIIDIKDMDNKRYKRYTGRNNSLMKRNLEYLLNQGKAEQMLIRVPYIGGYNTEVHVDENIKLLKELGVVNIERFTYEIPSRRFSKLEDVLLGALE